MRSPGDLRFHRRSWPVYLMAGLALAGIGVGVACSREVTGLRVVTFWNELPVDQLEFTAFDHLGGKLSGPERRPRQPAGPLVTGVDVVIYFPDELAGKEVHCDIRAFAAGELVATSRVQHKLVRRDVVAANATLEPFIRPNGAACTTNLQCASEVCSRDRVCCNEACAGQCQACNVPGKQGTCSAVPEGVKHPDCTEQGRATCEFDGTCDGRGACRKYPAGTPCAAGACNGSSITAAGACDGEGHCLTGAVVTCAPFGCDPGGGEPRCHRECTTVAECVPGRECVAGSCGKKLDGASCAGDGECSSDFCADGVCCDSRCDGPCVSCAQTGHLGTCRAVPPGVKDPRGLCPETSRESCGESGSCDGAGGCARYAAGTICKAAACQMNSTTVLMTASRCDGLGSCQAGSPLACAPYACRNGACNASCERNEDCSPERVCDAAKSCGKKGLGQPCGANEECETAFCVDGVCCNDACAGACRSCTLGRVPGMCTLVPAGAADPRKTCRDTGAPSCGTDGNCNGNGVCSRYAAGTVCSPGTCNPTTNVRTLASRCDIGGRCVNGATTSCGAYRCNGGSCFSACSNDADCVAPNVCIAGSCGQRGAGASCTRTSECMAPLTCIGTICQRKPLGQPCSAGGECASGTCTEGVCCEAASCGRCRSCTVAGSVGLCTAVSAGTLDQRCAMEPVAGCGQDGRCDGAGGCRNYPPGTVCVRPSCSGRNRINPRTCDGAGVCQDNGATDCNPYVCNPDTAECFTSCNDNTQCCCRRCRMDSCG